MTGPYNPHGSGQPQNRNAPEVESEAIQETKSKSTSFTQILPSDKEFLTVRAQFALCQHTLEVRTHKVGLQLWVASRWGQSRVFACWADVLAFKKQIGARP